MFSSEIPYTYTESYDCFWSTCQLKVTYSLIYTMWKASYNEATLFYINN